jgi:hypothetical protein
MGDIEDLTLQDGSVVGCITCPTHDHKLSLSDGQKYLQTVGPGGAESPSSGSKWQRCAENVCRMVFLTLRSLGPVFKQLLVCVYNFV